MAERRHMSKANKRKVYLKASDFMLDIAKLVFAGIILTGIMDTDVDPVLLFVLGSLVIFALCSFGYTFFIRGINKK